MKFMIKNTCLLTLFLGMFALAISKPCLDDNPGTDTEEIHWGV